MNNFANFNANPEDELVEKLFNLEIKENDKIYGKNITGELYNKIYNNLLNNIKNNIDDNDEKSEYYCISKIVQYSYDLSGNATKIDNFDDLIFVETKKFVKKK